MAKAMESIRDFAFIAFTLLGVLFGMMIMSFIFGQLGSSSLNLPDDTLTVINQSGAFINESIYTINEVTDINFNGGFAVLKAYNGSSGKLIISANYTYDPSGTLINATAIEWHNVSLTYTYKAKPSAVLNADTIQNNSLQAIVTYSAGASTQFNTVSIAIILGLLIAVFLIFWKIFVSNKKGSSGGAGTFG